MAPRFEKLDEYSGERGFKARQFLDRFKLAVRKYNSEANDERQAKATPDPANAGAVIIPAYPADLTVRQQTERFIFLCTEDAYSWAKPYIPWIHDAPAAGAQNDYYDSLGDWDDFQTEFLEQFSSVDDVRTAERQLESLSQGSLGIAEFTAKFRGLATQVDWNEAACISAYRLRIRENLRNAIAASPQQPTDYNDYLNWVIKLGEQLEEDRSNNNATRRTGGSNRFRRGNYGWNRYSSNNNNRSTVSSIPSSNKGSGSAAATTSPGNRTGLRCFECNKEGHFARDCELRRGNFRGRARGFNRQFGSRNNNQRAAATAMGDERLAIEAGPSSQPNGSQDRGTDGSMGRQNEVVLYERNNDNRSDASDWRRGNSWRTEA